MGKGACGRVINREKAIASVLDTRAERGPRSAFKLLIPARYHSNVRWYWPAIIAFSMVALRGPPAVTSPLLGPFAGEQHEAYSCMHRDRNA